MLEARTKGFLAPLEAVMDAQLETVANAHLQTAMSYSLAAGGKRLRPLLLLATVDTFGGAVTDALPAAAALEFVHTYSLIHDDLPAMDNDDLRRGQPTNHKQFGEALAILAGDALQTAAFSLIAEADLPATVRIALVRQLAKAAGGAGMVAGQVLDMDSTGQVIDRETLATLQAQKTGALLAAAVVMGGTMAEVREGDAAALRTFGEAFGSAFQIQDDLNDGQKSAAELGKTPNKDIAAKKATYPAVVGPTAAKQALDQAVTNAQAALDQLSVPAPQLAAFLTYFEEKGTA